ncbi:hypothetical protein CGRA01v4_11168 [Colletotrichum graminicola]|nr:hypothetical protein CGRA01v4_11168 [Colletotrichum graminicola]
MVGGSPLDRSAGAACRVPIASPGGLLVPLGFMGRATSCHTPCRRAARPPLSHANRARRAGYTSPLQIDRLGWYFKSHCRGVILRNSPEAEV